MRLGWQEEFMEWHAEGLCKLVQQIERRLPMRVFDLGQIRAIHFQFSGEAGLRHAALGSQPPKIPRQKSPSLHPDRRALSGLINR